jgi:23S rRNA (cytidine1920-2'-O)/16S rRNA (cytidine1409-2'-O)-methyltransferase
MTGARRERIDVTLVERGLAETRARAQALLIAGRVFVDGQRVDKPGTSVRPDAAIDVRGDAIPYVSRGGLKLAGVWDALGMDVRGAIAADIGASTGGFTDMLLQKGAARVHAVDVGKGLLHERIRNDARVVVHEGINARYPLRAILGETMDVVVMDVSFISLTKMLASAAEVLAQQPSSGASALAHPTLVTMVKPQFELQPGDVGRGGVVRDPALRQRAVDNVIAAAAVLGLHPGAVVESPVAGPAGNREVFVAFRRGTP